MDEPMVEVGKERGIESSICVPCVEVQFALDGIDVVEKLEKQRDVYFFGDAVQRHVDSRNPMAGELLKLRWDKYRVPGGEFTWNEQDAFWSWMNWLAKNNRHDEFESNYRQWWNRANTEINGVKPDVRTSNRQAQAIADLAVENVGLARTLLEESLESVSQMDSQREEVNEGVLRGMRVCVAKFSEVDQSGGMEIITKYSNLDDFTKSDVLSRWMKSRPRDGWKIAELGLVSGERWRDFTAFDYVATTCLEAVRNGNYPSEIDAVCREVSEQVKRFSTIRGVNLVEEMQKRRLEEWLVKLNGVRAAAKQCMGMKLETGEEKFLGNDSALKIMEMSGNVDMVDKYSPAGNHIFSSEVFGWKYTLFAALEYFEKKGDKQTVAKIHNQLRAMVQNAFSEGGQKYIGINELKLAVGEEDKEGTLRVLNSRFYDVERLGGVDMQLAMETIERMVVETNAPKGVIYEFFGWRVIDKAIAADPDRFLKLTEGVEPKDEHVRVNLKYMRAEAIWRLRLKEDKDKYWQDVKKVIENGDELLEMVGAIRSAGGVLASGSKAERDDFLRMLDGAETRVSMAVGKLSPSDLELINKAGEITFVIGNAVEVALSAVEGEARARMVLDFYRSQVVGKKFGEGIAVNPSALLKDLTVEQKKQIVGELNEIEILNKGRSSSVVQQARIGVGHEAQSLLMDIAMSDSLFVYNFLKAHPAEDKGITNMLEIRHNAMVSLPVTRDWLDLYSEIAIQTEKRGMASQREFLAISMAYQKEGDVRGAEFYIRTMSYLEAANKQLSSEKRTDDVEEFWNVNQVRMAKLMMLYPRPAHALALLSETAGQHGFARLEKKLETLDGLEMDDVVRINRCLCKRDVGKVDQKLLVSLISMQSAFGELGAKDEFMNVLERNVESDGIVAAWGRTLLVKFGENLGMRMDSLPDGAMNVWNLEYLPRLFEAARKFEETDKTMFGLIVKSVMKGEFATMIDPSGEVDLQQYSFDERKMVEEIRRHNRLTDERFVSRNLNREAFSRGATERRVKFRSSAEVAVRKGYEKVAGQLQKTWFEAAQLVDLGGSVAEIELVESELGLKMEELLSFLRDEEIDRPALTHEEMIEKVELILKKSLGSGKDAVGSLVDNSEARVMRRDRRWMRGFEWREGRLVDIPSEQVTLLNKIRFIEEKLAASEDMNVGQIDEIGETRNEAKAIIAQLESELGLKKRRPEIGMLIGQTSEMLNMAVLRLGSEIDDRQRGNTAGDVASVEGLKLVHDHMRGLITDVSTLGDLAVKAKTKDYDLTLRRWKREPGHDIFQGDYTRCCVSVESYNGYALMRYLVGKDVEVTEVIDNSTGDTVGQDFEFLGEGRDGRITFHIDNVELDTSVAAASDAIRGALFDMATETAKEMKVKADLPGVSEVVMGTSYNDVETKDLQRKRLRVRKVGGPMLGLKQYLDTFVEHVEGQNDKAMSPTSYWEAEVYKVAVLEEFNETTRKPVKITVEIVDKDNYASVKSEINRLESETFGVIGDSPEELEEMALDESSVCVVAKNKEGRVVGYSLGFNDGEKEVDGRLEKMLYVTSTAIDYDLQATGVNNQLQDALTARARQKGYGLLRRSSMADNGYAQRLMDKAKSEGRLVEPESIEQAEVVNYYGRPQYKIITRI